jgi:ParB/RepB/Spo0J family partition protein
MKSQKTTETEQVLTIDRILSDAIHLRPVDEAAVADLMLSLKSKGQQQPIKVRPKTHNMNVPEGTYYYVVIFGEHRLEACKRLEASGASIKGLRPGQIRALVQDVDENEALELKVTENAHRNSYVDPWEEGRIFNKLLREKYDNNLNALSESIGKATSYIKDRLQVFYNLHPSLRHYLGNELNIGNAIALSKTPNPEPQISLANAIIRTRKDLFGGGGGGLTGRQIVRVKCVCPVCGKEHVDRRSEKLRGQLEGGSI